VDRSRRAFGASAVGLLAGGALADEARGARVVLYTSTDPAALRPLIRDFGEMYPQVRVEPHHLNSREIYHRFRREAAEGQPGADVVWSSAMDLQIKLVNDGHALAHPAGAAEGLPRWAVWKQEAFGTTFEPIGIAYNRRAITDADVPRTRPALVEWLEANASRLQGRVATYDPEAAGIGWLLATEDAKVSRNFWDIARALGRCGVRLYTGTSTMLEDLASGQVTLAYNILGSYARPVVQRDPSLGLVLPTDYTLVVSRVAFVSRHARNLGPARQWLSYLLSRRGQQVSADRAGLFALHREAQGEHTASVLERELGSALRPIPIGPGLMAHLDQGRRDEVLHRWRAALASR
jgi:iron(III) transport system substrate-binding protein